MASFGMTFEWGPTVDCGDTNSPLIEVFNLPSSAHYVRLKLYNHTTGEFRGAGLAQKNEGGQFGYGDFASEGYIGPCSPPSSVYRLEVYALDRGGEIQGIATGTLRFP